MTRNSETRHTLIRFCPIALAILACALGVNAQSGRRTKGGVTPSTPTVSGEKTTAKKPDTTPSLHLLVGINSHEPFAQTPFYVYDTVLDECIRRLGDAKLVLPTSAGNNMDRADAVKAAKQETERWVVSLEVRSFYADSGRQVKANQDELYVDYTVIEPKTGNIKRSGRTSHHIYQSGRGGVTLPTRNGAVYSEYSIKQAAREAAERILAGFDIKLGN